MEHEFESCPICNNKAIKLVGEKHLSVEYSLKGKCLSKSEGIWLWWQYNCRCGWKSDVFTE